MKLIAPYTNVAAEGIIGPHSYHGDALLLAGLKPVFFSDFTNRAALPERRAALFEATLSGKLSHAFLRSSRINAVHISTPEQLADCLADFIHRKEIPAPHQAGTHFFCLRGNEQTMIDIFRFYQKLQTQPRQLSDAEHTWLGRSLGYTENDIALFTRKKYTAEERAYLLSTNAVRIRMRYEPFIGPDYQFVPL